MFLLPAESVECILDIYTNDWPNASLMNLFPMDEHDLWGVHCILQAL